MNSHANPTCRTLEAQVACRAGRIAWTLLAIPVLHLAVAVESSSADSWPCFRGDATRSARAGESLRLPLTLQWTHQAIHAPQPAWPRSRRMQFDRAYQVVAAGDRVLFGSSADGTVTALDGSDGQVAWKFFTEGPVRFAPALWNDRAFVVSDDGHLYALRLSDGALLWKRQGGPSEASVLGNGHLISKWPARGGPVVVDDVVYFAAGIWPSDGIFLYALKADSGDIVWCNQDSGTIDMPQPHGGANAKSGVSAQGYLVAVGSHLIVPTGRAVPAVFERSSGKLEFFHLQANGHNGGSLVMAMDDKFYNDGLAFLADGGNKLAPVGPGHLAVSGEGFVRASTTTLGEFDWVDELKRDRKGKMVETTTLKLHWLVKDIPASGAIMTAGDQVILGGDGHIRVFDSRQRKVVWQHSIEGTGYGLAIWDGKLLVSTDRGAIHCFANGPAPHLSSPATSIAAVTYPRETGLADTAEEIIRRSGIARGYCLDLGCADGSLAYELAKRTELQIVAVDPDPENVRLARKRLTSAGLYGTRVVVHCRDLSHTGYPEYFADLVVSGRAAKGSGQGTTIAAIQREAGRVQRPYGGVSCLGTKASLRVSVRAGLSGAGSWTHQYADAANTVNSDDQLVRGRLSMLWFDDVDMDIPSRHGRAPAPLFSDGRIYHEGMDSIVAVNAYNGREIWRYNVPQVLKAYNGDELMGTAGTGSNICVGDDSVYLRSGERCLRLNAATGTLVTEYQTPPDQNGKRKAWGYVAWVDGLLYGSEANDEHVVTYRYVNRGGDMSKLLTESRSLFALDTQSGKLLWRYPAQDSIRHNAIAIAGGKVVVIDRPLALFDRVKRPESKEHPTGHLLALDARTGTIQWQNDDDIYGTLLAVSEPHGVIVMSYQPTRFRLDSERGARMAAFSLDDGKRLWDIKAQYDSRPMINGRTIYAQGGAWDLLTGQPVPFEFTRSYGCGILASSRHMLVFRSATLGYYDLDGERKTENYGGIRPGCWINALPAGGIVLLPDASSGCRCSYLNRAWIGLQPVPSRSP